MFQIEDFKKKCSLVFLPNLEVTSTVWGFGSCICLGLWKLHLFGALEVASVWGFGSCICCLALEVTYAVWSFGSHICGLGLWKSHLFGALEVTSVWGFGSHICLGLWKSHLFGAVEVTSVWGFGSHICLGLWKSHLFGAVEVTSVWGCGNHICCLGLWKWNCFIFHLTGKWGYIHIITESLASVSLFGALDISVSVKLSGNHHSSEVCNDIKTGNWTDTFERTLGGTCVVNTVAPVWNGYILHVHRV